MCFLLFKKLYGATLNATQLRVNKEPHQAVCAIRLQSVMGFSRLNCNLASFAFCFDRVNIREISVSENKYSINLIFFDGNNCLFPHIKKYGNKRILWTNCGSRRFVLDPESVSNFFITITTWQSRKASYIIGTILDYFIGNYIFSLNTYLQYKKLE